MSKLVNDSFHGSAGAARLKNARLSLPNWFTIHRSNGKVVVRIGNEIGIASSAKDLLAELDGETDIALRIDSTGGSSTDALLLFDKLQGRVTTATITGKCFSAGVLLAMLAPHIRIEAGATMMIHPPCDWVYGQIADHEFAVKQLEAITARLREILLQRTEQTPEVVESWLSGLDFTSQPEEAQAVDWRTRFSSNQQSNSRQQRRPRRPGPARPARRHRLPTRSLYFISSKPLVRSK